jgi:cytochrome c553
MKIRNRLCHVLAITSALAAADVSEASPPVPQAGAVLHLKSDRTRGEEVFVGCKSCHGADGSGEDRGDTPAIAGQHRSVVIKELVDFQNGVRWDVRMERVADQHRLPLPQDLSDVSAYIASMPVQPTSDVGDGLLIKHGRAIYAQLCVSCHGREAAGSDARQVPRLAGQSYQYLLRQMYNSVDRRRPNLAGRHIALFRRFARDEFVGTADYLSRLAP